MQYFLRVIAGGELNREYAVGPGEWVVGRSKGVNVVIDSSKVSQRHCAFAVKGDSLFVKDLGSLNGIFVNGSKVSDALLDHGDRIVVGDYVFVVIKGAQ